MGGFPAVPFAFNCFGFCDSETCSGFIKSCAEIGDHYGIKDYSRYILHPDWKWKMFGNTLPHLLWVLALIGILLWSLFSLCISYWLVVVYSLLIPLSSTCTSSGATMTVMHPARIMERLAMVPASWLSSNARAVPMPCAPIPISVPCPIGD